MDKQLDREVLDFIAMQPGDKTHRMLVERGWTPPATDAPAYDRQLIAEMLGDLVFDDGYGQKSRSCYTVEAIKEQHDALLAADSAAASRIRTVATPPAGGGASPSTPSSRWAANGEPDPHRKQYDCERAALAMGDYTDDEIANAVFLHGNVDPSMTEMLAGRALPAIAYLTAAKDRIRWLSRRLAESAGGARVGQEAPDALDADELELFRQTVADFEDCEETSTDHDTLMRWAEMGLLECERFEVTKKGYALAAPTPETPYVDTRAERG